MYLIWECLSCKTINYSIDLRHHEMNYCRKCKESYVDFETYMTRITTNVKTIEKIDYNFFDELLLCFKEQGFKLPAHYMDDFGFPILFVDYSEIRDLEDKMIKELLEEYE